MQIVIEIANDIVDCLNNGIGITYCQYKSLVDAITNGTPLPKGHGRIVDENKITSFGWDNTNNHAVVYAPTIIEAESEE